MKKDKKNSVPMLNIGIGFVTLLLLILISMGISEQNSITASAVALAQPMDAATTAIIFMGIITIVSIIGLTLVSSLSLKILISKKRK